jgi:hypothetical protein
VVRCGCRLLDGLDVGASSRASRATIEIASVMKTDLSRAVPLPRRND